MSYPEPSSRDCGASWNEITDDEGNVCCDCTACQAARRRAARDEEAADRWERDLDR